VAWQRFAVELKGEGAPVIVQTDARDWANVAIQADAPKAMDMTFQVVHSALLRTGHDVPRNYDAFLEVLEGLPESLDTDGGDQLDPTAPARSDG
jgi:hypothetical protein